MEASELRIKNLIEYNGAICHVLTISKTSIRCSVENDLDEDMFNIEDLSGINLTEEWLVKFGFVKSGETPGRIKIDTDFGEVAFYVKEHGSPRIKYVHQLQNIYFALTGEELTEK